MELVEISTEAMNVIYGLYCVCEDCDIEKRVRYVGQSARGVRVRYYNHTYAARHNKPWVVSRWMRKHGIENIKHTVLEECASSLDLDEAEAHWIVELETLVEQGGCNIRAGGNSVRGYKHRDDARSRIPRSHSEETKRRLSEAGKGRVGSLIPNSIINEAMASAIKADLWRGMQSGAVAEKYGVSYGIVAGISCYAAWTHVPWPIGPRVRGETGRFQQGHRTGEAHPDAIFTESDIREIRRKHTAGATYAALGREYGTSGTNIRFIVKRITWKHVD